MDLSNIENSANKTKKLENSEDKYCFDEDEVKEKFENEKEMAK